MKRLLTVMTMVMALIISTVGMAAAQPSVDREDDILDQDDITTQVNDVTNPSAEFEFLRCDPGSMAFSVLYDNTNSTKDVEFNLEYGDLSQPGTTVVEAGEQFGPWPFGTAYTADFPMEITITADGVPILTDIIDPAVLCDADPSVKFTDGPSELDVNQPGTYEVTIENNGRGDFNNKWQLALEVEGDDLSESDITLSGGLDFTLHEASGILYVYGEHENDQLVAGYSETQTFEATFTKSGTFTGTVFLLDTGEVHPNVDAP